MMTRSKYTSLLVYVCDVVLSPSETTGSTVSPTSNAIIYNFQLTTTLIFSAAGILFSVYY